MSPALRLADVLELAHADTTVDAAAIGSTAAKIRRQEPSCRSTPETAGPSAGATDIASVTLPITRPRSLLGHDGHQGGHQQRHHHGGAARLDDPGDQQHPNVGRDRAPAGCRREVVIAVANAVRVLTRCRNQPVTGMTAAIVSMNAVESHWAAFSDDIEVVGQPRDRVDHDRLVEDHDERRRDEPA